MSYSLTPAMTYKLLESIQETPFLWKEISPLAKQVFGTDVYLFLLRENDGYLRPLFSPNFPQELAPASIFEEHFLQLVGEKVRLRAEDWQVLVKSRSLSGSVLVYPLQLVSWKPGYLLMFLPNEETEISHVERNPVLVSLTTSLLAVHLLKQELNRRMDDLSLLLRAATVIGSQLELDQTLNQILDSLYEVAGVSNAAILLTEDPEGVLVMRMHRGYRRDVTNIHIPKDKGVTGRAVKTGEIQVVLDVSNDPDYILGVEGAKSEMAIPLKVEGKVIGVLDIESDRFDFFDSNRQTLIRTLGDQIALALYNSILYERTQQMAITDHLTGLYNRRFFFDQAPKEVLRSERFAHPLSLIFLDLDDFKHYNDQFGHLAGDQLLIKVAQLLCSCTRETDFICRFGGEEFLVLMPETPLAGAAIVAERIRHCAETSIPMTISLGVAEFKQGEDTLESLLKKADQALYSAKQAGKNRVVF